MPENVNLDNVVSDAMAETVLTKLDNVVSDAMAEKVLTKLLLIAALGECSVGAVVRAWMDLLIAKRTTGGASENEKR